jgi:signal transduction histidine kinase
MSTNAITVLLIEDNPGDARLMREMLTEGIGTPFDLHHTDRLSTGLECLARGGIDVVLLDLSLPDSQGLDTFSKTYSHTPHVPIILLTGLDDEVLADRAVREGAQDYLVKGEVNSSLLRRAIHYAMERKRAEEERKKLEAALQRAQKMEAIGTLAGGVAHDLNNTLGAIVGYPDLLLGQIPEDSPMRRSLVAIRESGERAAAIVQDLLTLARRGVTATQVVNLNTVISEYLKSPEYEKLNEFHPAAHIETNLEGDLLNMMGSPVHLIKTIANLVSNAAEAMPEGGKVILSSENVYLDKPIAGYDRVTEGDYVVLSVSDSGVGISEHEVTRIFEPFYTKKMMGRSGTGLGMAVVWGAVKDHEGYIDVASTEGEGTTFKLYFPVTRKEMEETQGPLPPNRYCGSGEKILVIDDVASQRQIAASLLEELNYDVEAVSSGEEAVDHLRKSPADLLVLDMIMDPGIDGLETYKRIMDDNGTQKAIIASGFSETDRVRQAQRLGAGPYIKKPYTLEKIGSAVRAELDR